MVTKIQRQRYRKKYHIQRYFGLSFMMNKFITIIQTYLA